MRVLYFVGQNCHLQSILNIASVLVESYQNAFATLWGEWDFSDEKKHSLFVSKRIFKNLEALGVKIDSFDCDTAQVAQQSFERVDIGEFFFLGMDRFFVTWDPAFNGFHEEHYFFARKKDRDSMVCFDSFYNANNAVLSFQAVAPHVFNVGSVRKTKAKSVVFDLATQAEEVLEFHASRKRLLTEQILECSSSKDASEFLRKQIDALLNNRRLFAIFLHQTHKQFFNNDFLSKWHDLKNGALKHSLLPTAELERQLVTMTEELLDIEMDVARQLLKAL